jgi:uncharacterized protein
VKLNSSPWAKRKSPLLFRLARLIDLEARNEDGRTSLHAAIEDETAEVTEFLLSRNANVKAKDNEGNTPLHVQMEPSEHHEWIREITELLLANKADVNAKNNIGITPLMIAIRLKNSGAIELLQKYEKK